jgi:hypothetical protein
MIERLFDNVLSGYLAVCGGALLVGSLLLVRRALRLLGGMRADGTIVSYVARMREIRTGAVHYMPMFRFVADGAQEQVVQSRVGTIRPDRKPLGSRVTVLYDPANPSLAEIAGARIWLGRGLNLRVRR